MTAYDGEFNHVQNLVIYIADVNEKPFFNDVYKIGNILESETTLRVIMDLVALDQEEDTLSYEIIGSNPSGTHFSINATNGRQFFAPTRFICFNKDKTHI